MSIGTEKEHDYESIRLQLASMGVNLNLSNEVLESLLDEITDSIMQYNLFLDDLNESAASESLILDESSDENSNEKDALSVEISDDSEDEKSNLKITPNMLKIDFNSEIYPNARSSEIDEIHLNIENKVESEDISEESIKGLTSLNSSLDLEQQNSLNESSEEIKNELIDIYTSQINEIEVPNLLKEKEIDISNTSTSSKDSWLNNQVIEQLSKSYSKEELSTRSSKSTSENILPLSYLNYLQSSIQFDYPETNSYYNQFKEENGRKPKKVVKKAKEPIIIKEKIKPTVNKRKVDEKSNCHCQLKPQLKPYNIVPGTGCVMRRAKTPDPCKRCYQNKPLQTYQQYDSFWKEIKNRNVQFKVEENRKSPAPAPTKKTHPAVPSNYIPPPCQRRDQYRQKLRQMMLDGRLLS